MTTSAVVRDFAIIILAMQALVVNILLGILIWQVWRMVKMLDKEIKPVLKDTQETLSTLRGTATFMSDNVVDPVVRTSRSATKWRRTITSLTSDLRNFSDGDTVSE
jgi:hypothetical protein